MPSPDTQLLHILDNALADATRRAQKPDGTSWLTCHPGCTPCCHGVFRISALDAARLRAALRELDRHEPARAAAILQRASSIVADLSPVFPGDPKTGILFPENLEDERWDTFADLPETDRPCPVLDPATGRCELYAARPLTCRIFGPPVLNEHGLGMCELCYVGAPEPTILQGELYLEHHTLEQQLNAQLPAEETVIAWSLLRNELG